jgi:hypothetical protein
MAPEDILFPVLFTNVTCLRLSLLVVPFSERLSLTHLPLLHRPRVVLFSRLPWRAGNATSSQTEISVLVQEGPRVADFQSGSGFTALSTISLYLIANGSTSDLSQNFIRVNNTLDPQRLYRIQTLNRWARHCV